MVALAATNSATPSLPRTLILSRLEAARREADQAQANVQNLRSQVDAAEAESQNRQDKVRNLASQASQADPTYNLRVQSGPPVLPVKTAQFLFGQDDAVSEKKEPSTSNRFKNILDTATVFNTQGLAAGRIVNISA